jgi:tRNA dimethylallyltransferase
MEFGKSIREEFPIILIAGQTAVGKTDVAISLAKIINAEIISVDSMQVYKGMDIGTAKPILKQRVEVPHHLIDILEITESFDAARFVKLAKEAIDDIKSRNKRVIMCGGTGLYFKALIEGIGSGPEPDKKLRAELENIPLEMLLNELKEKDPDTFAVIDKNNKRRVIRAVEVIRLTGKPFSSLKSRWGAEDESILGNYRFFGLKREPGDLRQRINIRVDKMFEMGLVEETRKLLELGLEQNPTAMQALGYRQVVEYLKGIRSLEDTINLVKIRTWQFARRQMTWFKRHSKLEWINVVKDTSVEQVVAEIYGRIKQS